MSGIKKIIFAPFFLIALSALLYFYKPLLSDYLNTFFKEYGGIADFGFIAVLITISSLSFCLFATFSQNLKLTITLSILSALVPFIFLERSLALVTGVGLVLSLIICSFNIQTNLESYTNFQPSNILTSPTKLLSTFLLLTLSFGYFLHTNSIIQTQGFKIPDKIIDWAIELSLKGQNIPVKGDKYLAQIPTLTEEQINLLKQNPEVLEQYGIDPKDLDSLIPTTQKPVTKSENKNSLQIPTLTGIDLKDTLKSQIADSLNNMIKPYLFAVPAILAFLFYSLVSFCLWIISFFISPILSLIFYILEKSKFVKFEKEMREVKKIVI